MLSEFTAENLRQRMHEFVPVEGITWCELCKKVATDPDIEHITSWQEVKGILHEFVEHGLVAQVGTTDQRFRLYEEKYLWVD